jgi:hypothetical protein
MKNRSSIPEWGSNGVQTGCAYHPDSYLTGSKCHAQGKSDVKLSYPIRLCDVHRDSFTVELTLGSI